MFKIMYANYVRASGKCHIILQLMDHVVLTVSREEDGKLEEISDTNWSEADIFRKMSAFFKKIRK